MIGQLYNNVFDYNVYLCDSKKNIISAINYSNIQYSPRFDSFNELEFTVEYYENGIMRVEDKNYKLTKANNIIYLEFKNNNDIIHKEFFAIDDPNSTMDSNGIFTKSVHCYSLPYSTFQMRRLRGYQNQVRKLYDPDNDYDFNDYTKGGIINLLCKNYLYGSWTVGYINPIYLNVYHTFNFSDSTYIDVFKELEKNYNCFILFDSIQNQINIYSPEEVGENKGTVISYTNYAQSLSTNDKYEGLATRLKVYGKDGANIAKYNITGELFLEDYTFFLNDMSTSLKESMIAWNNLKASKIGEFTEYIDQLDSLDSQLTTKNNELAVLNQQLAQIHVDMDSEKTDSTSTTATYSDLLSQESAKNTEITIKNSEISSINSQILSINSSISVLHALLKIENNFSLEDLIELSENFIKESSLNLDQCSDEKQLYEYAIKYMDIKSKMPISIDIDLIDIFSCSDCQDQWDKVKNGDFVYVDVNELGYDYEELRIIAYQHNKTSNSLRVTLSNSNELNNRINKLNDVFTKTNQVSNTIVVNQDNYGQYVQDKPNIINKGDIIDTNNNSILVGNNVINQRGFTGVDIEGLGAIQIKNDKIIISNDNWQTYHTLLSGNGLYLETNNKTSRIVITPNYGIQIDKNTGTFESPVWTNVLFIDNDGNAIFKGTVEGGQIISDSIIHVTTDLFVGNDIYVGNNDSINKSVRLRTSGNSDVVIQGWTDIGPTLSIGYRDANADNTTPIQDLQSIDLNASEIWFGNILVHGILNCGGASFIGLTNGSSPYATQLWAAQKGLSTGSDSHAHTVVVGGVTYTTTTNTHSHSQN